MLYINCIQFSDKCNNFKSISDEKINTKSNNVKQKNKDMTESTFQKSHLALPINQMCKFVLQCLTKTSTQSNQENTHSLYTKASVLSTVRNIKLQPKYLISAYLRIMDLRVTQNAPYPHIKCLLWIHSVAFVADIKYRRKQQVVPSNQPLMVVIVYTWDVMLWQMQQSVQVSLCESLQKLRRCNEAL